MDRSSEADDGSIRPLDFRPDLQAAGIRQFYDRATGGSPGGRGGVILLGIGAICGIDDQERAVG